MDGRMRAALMALDVDPNGDDPRKVATTVLNGFTEENRVEMIGLSAALWHTELQMEEGDNNDPMNDELGVLSPKEIAIQVTAKLARLLKSDPREGMRWLREHPKTDPIPYMVHMDSSFHGKATGGISNSLVVQNNLRLVGENMEVGCGPGNIAAHLLERGIIPEGVIHLVDSNPNWLGYASALLRKIDGKRTVKFHPTGAAEVHVEDESIGTLWTALTLQWFDKNEGEPLKTIQRMKQILARDGTVFFVGEEPVNATANTPIGLHGKLDIGFSHGAFTYEAVCRMFEENGFVPERKGSMASMAMPTPDPAFLESLSPDMRKKAELMLAYSDHTMVGTAWRKA
jgi:SAM-dependent methyltransferase